MDGSPHLAMPTPPGNIGDHFIGISGSRIVSGVSAESSGSDINSTPRLKARSSSGQRARRAPRGNRGGPAHRRSVTPGASANPATSTARRGPSCNRFSQTAPKSASNDDRRGASTTRPVTALNPRDHSIDHQAGSPVRRGGRRLRGTERHQPIPFSGPNPVTSGASGDNPHE